MIRYRVHRPIKQFLLDYTFVAGNVDRVYAIVHEYNVTACGTYAWYTRHKYSGF